MNVELHANLHAMLLIPHFIVKWCVGLDASVRQIALEIVMVSVVELASVLRQFITHYISKLEDFYD